MSSSLLEDIGSTLLDCGPERNPDEDRIGGGGLHELLGYK